VDTKNGGVVQTTDFVHREGSAGWIVPRHEHDIALRILARGDAGAGAR
jgi:hypothetical protein